MSADHLAHHDGFVGPQTALAARNWGTEGTPRAVVRAYGQVKLAALCAARDADRSAGRPTWDEATWTSIEGALQGIIQGDHDGLFVVPLAQGGAGTSLNMNLNEAVVHLTLEGGRPALHPLEDVNRYQSTNDTFPTAATVIAYEGLVATEARVIRLQEELVRGERRWATQAMVGRTELQDALPLTLGQVFGAWAGPFERDRWRLGRLKERVRTVNLGGTALGTGLGAPRDYVFAAEKHLRRLTGLPLSRSQNLVDETSNLDKYSELAGGLRQVAENLVRLSQDLLYYTSSPVGELVHPRLQAASSQMPAKSNPVALEYVCGLAVAVQAGAFQVSQYVQLGRLQLNPYLPFVVEALLAMFDQLGRALDTLTQTLLPGLEARPAVLEAHLAASPALVNALAPVLGYDRLAALVPLLAAHPPRTFDALRALLADQGLGDAAQGLDPLALAQGLDPRSRP